MTYDELLEIAKEDKIKIDDFNEVFKPIPFNEDQYMYYTWEDAKKNIDKLINKNGNKLYQHLWTVVDGEGEDLILLNGSHICNRLGYVVCSEPWGDGTEADSNIYIEAEY